MNGGGEVEEVSINTHDDDNVDDKADEYVCSIFSALPLLC